MRRALAQLPSFMVATAALGALLALGRFRPALPEMPDSLSAPVTTTFLQGLAVAAAWLLAVIVVLLLLGRTLRLARASRSESPERANLPIGMRAPARVMRGLGEKDLPRLVADEPKLLVGTPRDAQPTSPDKQSDRSLDSRLAAARVEPDPLPLVSLLGPLTIHGGKRSRRGLRARALELIAFLALRRVGAQRDEVLEALWPGEAPERSRHRLYQAVGDARRLLGEAIASERDRYSLDRSRVRVDVDELEELLKEARRADPSERTNKILEKALTLFRAEPLAGCDYLWVEGELRRLRVTYVELLKRVGRARLETGDAERSLEAAERGLAIDALDEDVWRLALEAEGALGLREAIEARYGRLRDLLQERLALEPARETREVYLRLLGQS